MQAYGIFLLLPLRLFPMNLRTTFPPIGLNCVKVPLLTFHAPDCLVRKEAWIVRQLSNVYLCFCSRWMLASLSSSVRSVFAVEELIICI